MRGNRPASEIAARLPRVYERVQVAPRLLSVIAPLPRPPARPPALPPAKEFILEGEYGDSLCNSV